MSVVMNPISRWWALALSLALSLSFSAHGRPLHASAEDEARVRVVVRDATGHGEPQACAIFPGEESGWDAPLAEAAAGQEATVKAGRVWVVTGAEEEHRQLVTLVAGETREVAFDVPRSLWLSFRVKDQTRRVLLRLRSQESARNALGYVRGRPVWSSLWALPRPEAAGADGRAIRAEARAAALAHLPNLFTKPITEGLTKEEGAAYWLQRSLETQLCWGILTAVGQPEDIAGIAAAIGDRSDPKLDAGAVRDAAEIISVIEARHGAPGQRSEGELVRWLTGDNPLRAWAAAIGLARCGDDRGAELLRASLRTADPLWTASDPAHALLHDDSPATLDAMRALLQLCLPKPEDPPERIHVGPGTPAAMYLLVHGSVDDWRSVARLSMGGQQAMAFASLAENPMEFVGVVLDTFGWFSARTMAINAFLDRPEDERAMLLDLVNGEVAERGAASVKNERDRATQYSTTMNTSQAIQTFHEPFERLVGFYGGFERNTPIRPTEKPSDNLSLYLRWMIEPEMTDLFVREWRAGRVDYLFHLDHIPLAEIEARVAALGNPPPPAWELFRHFRRVATRQFRSSLLEAGDGASHFPFVTRYRDKAADGATSFGGGISGVADVRVDWRDERLHIAVRLRQRSMYNDIGSLAGRIARDSKPSEWTHHRYMLEFGRALIERADVRCGETVIEATELRITDDGWMVFVADVPATSRRDMVLDLRLKFLDQALVFTESLCFGEQARRMCLAAANADAAAALAATGGSHAAIEVWAEAEFAAGRIQQAAKAIDALGRALDAGGGATGVSADERIANTAQWAKRLAAADRVDLAVALLERQRASAPDNVYLAGEIARTYYRAGAYENAVTAIAAARVLAPDDDAMRFTHAASLVLLGRFDEADPLLASIDAAFSAEWTAALRYIAAKSSAAVADEAATKGLESAAQTTADADPEWSRALAVLGNIRGTKDEGPVSAEALCRLHLARGYRDLFAKRPEQAKGHFTLARATHQRSTLEWKLADVELARLKKEASP